jgi:Zn-dependent protease with chaperone function
VSAEPHSVSALYFDGRSGCGQPVRVRVDGSELVAEPLALPADTQAQAASPGRWPLRSVQWPERTRHGQRQIDLPGRASLQVADSAAFDAWRRNNGPRESWVVRTQQNWRATAAATLAVGLVLVAGWLWGVPWAARTALLVVPASADDAVGAAALQSIAERWLKPSTLAPQRQQALHKAFADAVQAAFPAGDAPRYTLRFASAHKALGPNAFALPGGSIVLTDALVNLLQDQDDAVLGVLAHELGHVQHRHGMRALLQFTLLGAAAGAVLGDFSSLLAAAPALMAQLSYSRDAEREADAMAVRVLRASGRSPAVMAVFFEKIAALPERSSSLPIALASHPADAERVRFFSEAARVQRR